MKKLIAALGLLALAGSATAQNAPDPAAGKSLWEGNGTECRSCHGKLGEGAFGPDLAGRGLSAAQFTQAVRTPWGVMPAFVTTQVSDADLANIAAYFATLPKNPAPGPWAYPVDASQPHGQQVMHAMGCAQCHNPTFDFPRQALGGSAGDFEQFKRLVYTHTTEMPIFNEMMNGPPPPPDPSRPARRLNMGNFSTMRVPESQLRAIYDWAKDDIGFRPSLQARLSATPGSATYNLALANTGLKNKGMVAQGLTVDIVVPAGLTVASATGTGYKGVHSDGANTVAEWSIARLAPKDSQALSLTLSAPVAKPSDLKGTLRWAKPAPKTGPSTDVVNIALPAPRP